MVTKLHYIAILNILPSSDHAPNISCICFYDHLAFVKVPSTKHFWRVQKTTPNDLLYLDSEYLCKIMDNCISSIPKLSTRINNETNIMVTGITVLQHFTKIMLLGNLTSSFIAKSNQ